MTVPTDTIWELDPHTAAKHEILKKYLQSWLPILGSNNPKVVFIDGFSGPGRYKGGELGSPIIALKAATNHISPMVRDVVFLFIDEREDRIAHLKTEIQQLTIPANYKIICSHGQFDKKLTETLDRIDSASIRIAPTFVFVDPFGFAGVPYSLISRLLNKPKCETLITFMVDAVNRWLSHPQAAVRTRIEQIFGTSECFDITGLDRIERLRDLYQRQLQKSAKFVRYFEMRNIQGRVVYLLFFATNHRLGHLKMKEAMWAVDPKGNFRFSDRTNSAQQVMFQEGQSELLWPIVRDQFRGESVNLQVLREFVEDETPFLAKHMRATLASHETGGSDVITVAELKVDGKRRRRGTFPDGAIITFP